MLALTACKNRTSNDRTVLTPDTSADSQEEVVSIPFPALEAGEVIFKDDKNFGGTIELTGECIYNDDSNPIRVSAPPLIVYHNGYFAMTGGGTPVILFKFDNQIEYIGGFGMHGRGPGEIVMAQLVKTSDPNAVTYLYDYLTDRVFFCGFDGEVREIASLFPAPESGEYIYRGMEDLINIAEGDYIYACNIPNSKAIFRATLNENGEYDHQEIYNLRDGMKLKTWTAYLGDLGANINKNRVVYAYKYYKMLRFIDMESGEVKTIRFENTKEYDHTIGMDQNVTHYWGMTYNDEHIFVFHSGRTPHQVMTDNNKRNYYASVEQYDWNGNPIARYKIDDWGILFTDDNSNLYSASMNKEGPFYRYFTTKLL